MNRVIVAGIFEVLAVMASLVATYLEFGVAATLYLLAAWGLIFGYVLTPKPKRRREIPQ